MSEKKVFVNGIYPRERTEKTPDWVIGSFGINLKQFYEWAKENREHIDDNGFLNIQMATGQSGKPYAAVSTWKPKQKQDDSGGEDFPF